MSNVQDRIGELEGILIQANKTSEEVRERETSLQDADAHFRELIKELQGMIEDGQSSGDPALDVVVMLAGTVAKDLPYQRLDWLQDNLVRHTGELICVEGEMGVWKIAIIPHNVCISWDGSNVVLPTERFLSPERSDHIPRETPEPIQIPFNKFTGTHPDLPTDEKPVVRHDLKFHIGNEQVQAWAETLGAQSGLMVACACRTLGAELEPWSEVAQLLQDRREAEVASLLRLTMQYEDLWQEFRGYQKDPASFLARYRVQAEPTENGVNIDFDMGRQFQEVKSLLSRKVHVAVVLLGMDNNPTLREAAEIVGYELPE